MRFLICALLSALCIAFPFQYLPGFSYTGSSYLLALVCALLICLTGELAKAAGKALLLSVGINSTAKRILVLAPVWLLGIWLVPAFELMLISSYFPFSLQITGAIPALQAALVLALIQAASTDWQAFFKPPCQC